MDDSRWFDPKTGYDRRSRIYSSLRPRIPLPPPDQPLSIADFALTLLRSSSSSSSSDLEDTPFFISAFNDEDALSYAEFLRRIQFLSISLRQRFSLSQNDVAFILSPPSLHLPVLYFSLLSLGVVICPANPIGTESEVSHQVRVSKPVIAFATSHTSRKLPSNLPLGVVLMDSPEFLALLTRRPESPLGPQIRVNQSDPAAILYSSGTTGAVKGVILTHRNFISSLAGSHGIDEIFNSGQPESSSRLVSLVPVPIFHVFGFSMLIRALSLGGTLVQLERFDFEMMLKAVEKYKVSFMPVSPPLIVAMIKSELTNKYDLSSLVKLGCGGAPLGKDVAEKFKTKFPNVEIVQGYGLTETTAQAARTLGPDETVRYGSTGRLSENMEAKIVDPTTGEPLPPGHKGELWLRGPTIMKGYIGDDKATVEAFDSDGWLKTGDLCYFDHEGFLYIVDRLKELIKYKAYQVPPAELEQLLQSHTGIADAAVVPYPDEEAGEIPMAFVVRKPGSNIDEAQVMDFVAKQVAPYKKIRRVAFINSIPKNPSGKILRRELVSLALSGNSSKL